MDPGAPFARQTGRIFSRASTPPARMRSFHHNRLGQYVLTRGLPVANPDPVRVVFKGVGGENYRPFYHKWSDNFAHLLERQERWFSSPDDHRRFCRSIRAAMEVAKQDVLVGPDDMFTHYRAFRARFHMGCPSVENVQVSPLTGRWMDRVALAAGNARMVRGQALYDVIHNLAPDLLEVPFDDPGKAPTAEIREELTSVDHPPIEPGRVFIHTNPRSGRGPAAGPTSTTEALAHLEERYHEAVTDLPEHQRNRDERTTELLREAVERGGLRKQRYAQFVHYGLLWGAVNKLDA